MVIHFLLGALHTNVFSTVYRPLVLGRRMDSQGREEWCIASEDCAFGPIGFDRVSVFEDEGLPGYLIAQPTTQKEATLRDGGNTHPFEGLGKHQG